MQTLLTPDTPARTPVASIAAASIAPRSVTPPSLAPSSLSVSTVTTVAELERCTDEWTRLLARTCNTLPFTTPEWLLTWWETFRQKRSIIRDSLRVKLVRRRTGELVGLVPFMLTERPGFGPLRARSLGFLGADENLTEQRAAVVDPACEAHVARALAADLGEDRTWDWIQWEGLDPSSAFTAALAGSMPLQWGRLDTGNLVRLAPTWDAFKAGLKRNLKESLRHCYNSLKRDGFAPRLVVSDTPRDIGEALDTFFALHAMRAEQTSENPHPNRFVSARTRNFLRALCARFAERGATRVFTLYVDGAPVAARVGFLLPDCLYLHFSGFDPAWSKYSVMTTALAEVFKYAIGQGLSSVHLSMGADRSKSRWAPEMPAFRAAVCVRDGRSSRAALSLYTWARATAGQRSALARLLPKRRFD